MKRLVAVAAFLFLVAPWSASAGRDERDDHKTAGAAASKTAEKQRKPAAKSQTVDAQSESDGREAKVAGGSGAGARIGVHRRFVPGTTPHPPRLSARPRELRLTRAPGRHPGGVFDLRDLPWVPPVPRERPEREDPAMRFEPVPPGVTAPSTRAPIPIVPSAPAPPPSLSFDGLDRFNWGAGSPPDANGDVGPNHYIQTVNTSIGVYDKSGNQLAAFTFDTFMSQGNFGNLCDTNNFGDPVVLYDTFEDRWVITDFAFQLDGGGNVINPPGNFQCVAVSKTGDPVSGGWNFYSINTTGGLGDYPKFGIWTDGLYMTTSMFGYPAGAAFQNPRFYAFNKAQMYAGAPTVQVVSFDGPAGDFTILPSNARLQTGTPAPGTPNYYVSSWLFTNALTVYKFHVDWQNISLSTFTGPDVPTAATSWPNAAVANAPQPGTATLLDVLQIRAMVQNQYTKLGGVESLWVPHTVRRQNTSGFAAPRWYQVNVTGGTVAAALPQAATWDPDGANVIHRFMPSLAIDRAGNMAMGYSTSNATTEFPSIKYAGRLAGDPINTFSQTEQTLFTGTASQTGTTRWGDYSSMTLDPDGCTFWYTNEYANPADQTFNHRWLTRIGSFRYPAPTCVTVGAGGTLSGTVTVSPGGAPISGATVTLGARSTTTDGTGAYQFLDIPAGTYPGMTAAFPGYTTATASSIVVTDGGTTTQDFALTAAPTSACLTDTTQADFLAGVGTNLDLNTSPGDMTLLNAPTVDQQNTAGTTTGTGFGTPAWTGQTFIAGVTGQLVKADVQLFCNGCGATPPNLTLSVRATATGLPTGADLASVTIPGATFASGATTLFTATFPSPATLTSGTQYALVLRPVSAPAGSGYFWIRSSPSTYASGSRVLSADSGGTWSADTTRDYNFKTYMQVGFAASGNLVSSVKDANPFGGLTPIWSTLSWNASTPANTSLRFQMAGSNNPGGPFNFIGPDGTAGTFFTTSPASLGQFTAFRYLKYKAYLASTNPAVTPTLSDATICFTDTDCSAVIATITPTPTQVCENSTGNTASGPAGETAYAWGVTNGSITGGTTSQTMTYTAGASGNVGLNLSITAPSGCPASSSTNVPIVATPATPTITPGGPTTFCAGGSVMLTSSSATGNQWYLDGSPIGGATDQTYIATASGSYTVVVTTSGCASAASAATVVTVNPIPATPTVTPGGPTTFCPGGSVTLTSSSATGNQWYLTGSPIGGETNQSYVATASGDYTVTVTSLSCTSSPSTPPTTVTVNPIPSTPTITPGGPTTFCAGGSVTLTSSSATGNQWYLNGNPIGGATNQTYVATASGDYTVVVTTSGCSSAVSSAVTVTVNPIPSTPTATPGGPTTFCAGGSVTLTSSSATGDQWYLGGSPIGGATNQSYVATASGDYTVTVTSLSCTSSPSTPPTTVTVNSIPSTPTITPGGPTTFCAGGSVTLTSSSATGNQWYLNGNPIGGATSQTYVATASGSYTVVVTASGCASAGSAATVVTVNPIPSTPTVTPGGPTTFCAGGSVTLTSSSPTGDQWYLGGSPIGGATNQSYLATATGDYTVTVTSLSCTSSPSTPPTTVTVNPIPSTPTITPGGPTTICTGGSVTLTSSSATGNQWYLNGNPIGGATNQSYVATAAGSYTVVVTASGCTSSASAPVVVTVNPPPDATISVSNTMSSGATSTASVADAGVGATYAWSITGGTITGGAGTRTITFKAGAAGTLTLGATVTRGGCSDVKSANVTVTGVGPSLTVAPATGQTIGGTAVTIRSAGFTFVRGATVTIGGTPARNVVVVNGTTINATTPAHAAGVVDVVVTNPGGASVTLTGGFTIMTQKF